MLWINISMALFSLFFLNNKGLCDGLQTLSLMLSIRTDQEELPHPPSSSCGEPVWCDWVSYWKRWGTGDYSICCFWAPFHFHPISQQDHRAATESRFFEHFSGLVSEMQPRLCFPLYQRKPSGQMGESGLRETGSRPALNEVWPAALWLGEGEQ